MTIKPLFFAALLLGVQSLTCAVGAPLSLEDSIRNPQRSPQFVARDSARHPNDVLTFAGIHTAQSVIEIWPSGGYWSEMLAPYMAPRGQYRLVLSPSSKVTDADQIERWQKRWATAGIKDAAISYGFLGKDRLDVGSANSADLILTFRNVHNWMEQDYADQALKAMFLALKPGGHLLIEEHRGRTDKPQDPKAQDGYVREDVMIQMAERAGFKLVKKSELLANPRDIKDYPEGVWTLPPTLALGEQDRAKYLAIGEADNFLMLFAKP